MSCISKIGYTMTADIYMPMIDQDPESGAAQKYWIKTQTVPCRARGILRKGVGQNSTSFDVNQYINIMNDLVKMRTAFPIDSYLRISNIRNLYQIIYAEGQDPSSEGGVNGATIFEPRGSTPIINFDGRVLEYETVLLRQEIQKLEVRNEE